ncbi:CHAD domain-containing protein [Pararoseomonas indoligenes]|uniref:CHAD domain-containing protein n=1 Tax=Roseomonas indoligenes TaxID=2820811 RepID=A0A940MV83_9PROT|nr:CHAD domain-containing protein [Pararoseomonas indoligenes]MBP0492606.1 CHAD domain-containing protein [Pararoseomonas indoligenes]
MPTDGSGTESAAAPVIQEEDATAPRPRLPDAANWPPGATGGEAFHYMVEATLAALTDHRPAAVACEAEGVHQMRVAVRRLRAVLATFDPDLPGEAEDRFKASLRRLGRILGEARDWDVFITEVLPAAAVDGVPIQDLARLEKAARQFRAAAQPSLRAAVSGPGFANTVESISAWAQDAADPSSPQGRGRLARPARKLAPRLQKRLARTVLQRGRHIRRRSETELHELRKALKRLRYGVELLAPLHESGRKTFRRACQSLQEKLGALNDAVVAAELTRRLEADDPSLAPQAKALRAWTRTRRERAMAGTPAAWRVFKKVELPRLAV